MSYNCTILADSLSPQGHRLTTMKITFPRIVHAELMTHRMFSRNSASSRAIPFKKMVKMVEENPFIPITWQFDHKGMQGSEYVTEESDYGGIKARNESWLQARDFAIQQAKDLSSMDTTKQLCNRLLEPFMWHTVIVTASEWENFFELRCPKYEITNQLMQKKIFHSKKDVINYIPNFGFEEYSNLDWLKINQSQAEIHIQAIAELMWDEYQSSQPKQLESGEWHIPNLGHEWDIEKIAFITKSGDTFEETNQLLDLAKIKIATAHCAKISYDNFGTKVDYEADIRLHDMLLESKHASPFEHIARAMSNEEYDNNMVIENGVHYPGRCRNFTGFISYRSMVDNGKD